MDPAPVLIASSQISVSIAQIAPSRRCLLTYSTKLPHKKYSQEVASREASTNWTWWAYLMMQLHLKMVAETTLKVNHCTQQRTKMHSTNCSRVESTHHPKRAVKKWTISCIVAKDPLTRRSLVRQWSRSTQQHQTCSNLKKVMPLANNNKTKRNIINPKMRVPDSLECRAVIISWPEQPLKKWESSRPNCKRRSMALLASNLAHLQITMLLTSITAWKKNSITVSECFKEMFKYRNRYGRVTSVSPGLRRQMGCCHYERKIEFYLFLHLFWNFKY